MKCNVYGLIPLHAGQRETQIVKRKSDKCNADRGSRNEKRLGMDISGRGLYLGLQLFWSIGGKPFLLRTSRTTWDPADALQCASGQAAVWPICAV